MSFGSVISKIALVYRWFRATVFNLLFISLILIIVIALLSSPKLTVPDNSALHLLPTGMLVDQLTYQPSAIDLFDRGSGLPGETRVSDLVKAIEDAAQDDRIKGMVLQLDYFIGGGLSKMLEVGQALEKFKASGKPIIASAENYSQQQYFLASYADEIVLQELGSVLIHGFGVYRNYFLEAEKKLALDVHVFRVGSFKDAVEPFLRDDMSEASKLHNRQWLDELWQRYTDKIEQHRNLDAGALERYISDLGQADASDITSLLNQKSSNALLAKASGLVDHVMTLPELRQFLTTRFGIDKKTHSFRRITHTHYLAASAVVAKALPLSQHTIGLIVATGNIVDGEQPKGAIGGDSLAALIRSARDDDSLSALVLRIDSGGGSVFASEVIRQEILSTRQAGLPVYISMGSVAASGGYWVATAGDEVWATPETITGSIGVFGVLPNFSRSLNRLGVNSDGIGTSAMADIFHPDRPLASEAKVFFQHSVNNIYRHFIQIVADTRNLSVEQAHALAQGRVWTGLQAKKLGLVDELGSLSEVIEHVAQKRGLDDYSVKEIEQPLSTQEQLLLALDEMMQGVVGDSLVGPIGIPDSLAWLYRSEQKLNAAYGLTPGEQDKKAIMLKALCVACEAL